MSKKSMFRRNLLTEAGQKLDKENDETIAIVPKKDRWWESQIYIYTGGQVKVSKSNVAFDRNVPTFVDLATIRKHNFEDDPTTRLYNPAVDGTAKTGRKILLRAPTILSHFISAILTFDRIALCFPGCPVVVKCNEEWKHLLPPSVQYYAGPQKGETYYREYAFDTEIVANKLNSISLAQRPAHELILSAMRFYDHQQDKGIAQYEFDDSPFNPEIELGFIDTGTQFSVFLKEALAEHVSFEVFKTGKAKVLELAKVKRFIVGGECGEALMVGYMNKPTLAFIQGGPINYAIQYKQYPKAIVLPTPALADITKTVAKVLSWINPE